MKNAFLLICLLICIDSSAQFNHIAYKADCDLAYRLAIDSLQYPASLKHLSKTRKKYGKLYCEEYILMAHCYKKMGKETKSAKCLRTAWSNYAYDLVCLGEIPQISLMEINAGYSKKQQAIVQQGYDNFPKLNRSNTDSLKRVLEVMMERDQAPRIRFSDSLADTSQLYKEIVQTDSLNLIEFRGIIYQMGYPGEWILPGNVSRVFVLLVHSSYNQAFFDEMKPVFLKEVIAGRMPPSHYALWLDRHYSMTREPQPYGMLAIPGKTDFTPEQIREIIAKRLEIGLVKNCSIPTYLLAF